MKKTKNTLKRAVVLVAVCICCLGLTACGKNSENGNADKQTESQAEQATQEKKTADVDAAEDIDKNAKAGSDGAETTEAGENAKAATEDAEDSGAVLKNGRYILARPSQNDALSVKGSQLVDESGQAVQLRGISTHGIAWFPDYINQDMIMQLSTDWGANLLRIAMYTDENGGYCTDGDKGKLKQLILDGVEYAKQADMYVIVDWHILHDNNPLTHKEEALQFFREMTGQLKNEKHVLYEICNEPNSGCSWEDIKTYANEVIPVIRENAPDAVILVGTPTWSQEIDKPQNDPITGYDNIMYTLHFYAATHKEDLRNKMVNAVEAGTPVFVSEYGLCDASGNGGNDLGQAQSWIDTMDSLGISYATWSLCNKAETAALIASSCQKTSGLTEDDLSESGKWIMDMLHTVKTEDGSTQTVVDSKDKTQNQNNGSGVSERTEADETEGKTGTDVSEKRLNSGNLSVDAKLTGSWESEGRTFYQYQLTITNNGEADVSSWEISLTFSGDIQLSDGWNGEYQVNGKKLTISSKEYNGEIKKGASAADVGFIVSAAGTLEIE